MNPIIELLDFIKSHGRRPSELRMSRDVMMAFVSAPSFMSLWNIAPKATENPLNSRDGSTDWIVDDDLPHGTVVCVE